MSTPKPDRACSVCGNPIAENEVAVLIPTDTTVTTRLCLGCFYDGATRAADDAATWQHP